jgi:hypothetical protein
LFIQAYDHYYLTPRERWWLQDKLDAKAVQKLRLHAQERILREIAGLTVIENWWLFIVHLNNFYCTFSLPGFYTEHLQLPMSQEMR